MDAWWKDRWLKALEASAGPRFRQLASEASKARLEFLEVEAGALKAKIRKGRQKPFFIKIAWPVFSARQRERFLEKIEARADWRGSLADGRLPEDACAELGRDGIRLFPETADELQIVSADSGEKARKHAMLAHFYFAEAIGKDPALLFEFRGISRDLVGQSLHGPGKPEILKKPAGAAPAPSGAEDPLVFWQGQAAADTDFFAGTDEAVFDPDALGKAPYTVRGVPLNEVLSEIHARVRDYAAGMLSRGEVKPE